MSSTTPTFSFGHVHVVNKVVDVAMFQQEEKTNSLSVFVAYFLIQALDDVVRACGGVEAPQPARSSVFSLH